MTILDLEKEALVVHKSRLSPEHKPLRVSAAKGVLEEAVRV